MNNKDFRQFLLICSAATLVCAIFSGILLGFWGSVIILALGVLIVVIQVIFTQKRYRDIRSVNDYLSKILSGDYSLDIQTNEEGELSILRNNIYKATILLREQNELLAKEKNYLVDMLANISHQLKTPLTSVMMMNELLAKEESAEKRREFLDIEEKQLDKMNWLIQNLLKLSKLDAGTITLKSEAVSASALIDESLSPFLIRMDVEEISLNNTIDDTILQIDKDWTAEALRNIIKNCLEHMNPGGSLTVTNSENNLFHSILIKDSGCGIAPGDLPHIFDRFYKGKDSPKESIGIGLALSKAIIESQHGEILVTSTPGTGTCFEIRFNKYPI